RFFAGLALPKGLAEEVAGLILGEIRSRLRYLVEVGLEYLALDRQSRTLSGGELERVDLTTAIGSSLVNTLYVLDEPSVGLHPRDTERLTRILHRLRDLGNAVVVVEHDPTLIRAADHVIDLGPGAGERGGQVVFAGPPVALATARGSATAEYLTVRALIPVPPRRRKPILGLALRVRGASANNLKSLDASARTEEARPRAYTAATFSYNVPGGRCETCAGEGFEKIEMQFLSDVYVPCAECGGARFRPQILEVRFRGRSIRDVLDLTVAEATALFADVAEVGARLQPLADVG